MWRNIIAAASVSILSAASALADDVVGLWRTEDGNGIVELTRCGPSLCGTLVWFSPEPPPGVIPRDDENPDPALRNRPICGLPMLWGFTPDGAAAWRDGAIYDAQDGKTYHANLRLDSSDRLRLRGYVGIPMFGQTQIWTRVTTPFARCR